MEILRPFGVVQVYRSITFRVLAWRENCRNVGGGRAFTGEAYYRTRPRSSMFSQPCRSGMGKFDPVGNQLRPIPHATGSKSERPRSRRGLLHVRLLSFPGPTSIGPVRPGRSF